MVCARARDAGRRSELRVPGIAAQTRMVSLARIRLVSRKSPRIFKRIICDDVSEFESYMPSHAVRSRRVTLLRDRPRQCRVSSLTAGAAAAWPLAARAQQPVKIFRIGYLKSHARLTRSGSRSAPRDLDMRQQRAAATSLSCGKLPNRPAANDGLLFLHYLDVSRPDGGGRFAQSECPLCQLQIVCCKRHQIFGHAWLSALLGEPYAPFG
jgi:hypothetical protein